MWNIDLVSSSMTTMMEFYTYDLNEFIAELGGSWGLFLGASLITIFDCIDKFLAKIFTYAHVETHVCYNMYEIQL